MNSEFQAKSKVADILSGYQFIRGIGLSVTATGSPCVVVYVPPELSEEENKLIPKKVDDIPVRTRVLRNVKDLARRSTS
jgi:hypothetical protein